MPSYQFLAVARIQPSQRDIVYFGKQDISGFSFLHNREPELRCKNVQQDVQLFPVPEPTRATLENIIFPDTGRAFSAALLNEPVGNDSNLLIVFYVQIMPDDFVMQLHRF